MAETKLSFKPIRTTESFLEFQKIFNGAVYFTTDTGKIYMDTEDKRICMSNGGAGGGGAGILYANCTRELKADSNDYYELFVSELEESTTLPAKGMLVLNQDGSFYRIISIVENSLYCKRITVSGGNSSSENYSKRISVDIESLESTSTFVNGQDAFAKITVHSGLGLDGAVLDAKNQISAEVLIQAQDETGNFVITKRLVYDDLDDGQEVVFNFGVWAKHSATSRIVVKAEGINSGTSVEVNMKKFTMNELTLTLAENFTNENIFNYNDINITCNAIGNLDRIVDFYWDNELIESKILLVDNAADTGRGINCAVHSKVNNIDHGVHNVRIELYQYLGGERKLGVGVTPITFEVGVNSQIITDPIIWLGDYKKEYYNYEDIEIPYFVWDPAPENNSVSVYLYKNNILNKSSVFENVSGTISSSFEIIDADEQGMINSYVISCKEGVPREINFKIIDDPDRDMHIQQPRLLKLTFDAKGRSNDEAESAKKTWSYQQSEQSPKIIGELKDFNWYNNGWIKTEDGTALRISNGASFSIPMGNMVFSGPETNQKSHTIEIQFKIRNVQSFQNVISNITRYKQDSDYYKAFLEQTQYLNYDAFLQWYAPQVGSSYDEITEDKFDYVEKHFNLDALACSYYSGSDTAPIGFGIGPQDAFFSNGTNTVNASFVEDKLVNLSIVYSDTDKLMTLYVNGILTGVISSTLTGSFTIGTDNLVFNSKYCDIDLYKIRIYDTELSINEIGTNYAVDLKDVVMYDQNMLVDPNNKTLFSYNEMIKYNEAHPEDPIMPYIVFDTSNSTEGDRLSWSKKTKPNISVEFVNTALDRAYSAGELDELAKKDKVSVEEYYIHHCPSWKGDNISMAVQGTSSEFYPRRNYKLKTKDANKKINMTMHRGPFAAKPTDTKWFYMDNYSVGTTKFTMKIDFMESSGSYNRGLANLINNAHSHHPLYYYNQAGAITEKIYKDFVITPEDIEWNKKTVYFYKNHKGNYKPADGSEKDGLKISSAEDLAKGPIELAKAQNVSKVLGLATNSDNTLEQAQIVSGEDQSAYYNKWFTGTIDYQRQDIEKAINLNDLRTNVQGFPVLAFHKKSDGSYTYIGRYNMLTDKGSDETFGFKMDNAYISTLGNKDFENAAECWEFENNARGLCSFRDPLGRKHLSFNDNEYLGWIDENGEKAGSKTSTAPRMTEDFEYRYHVLADDIDIIVGADATRMDSLTTEQKETLKKNTKRDITNSIEGQDFIFDLYGNWEKAVAWVWSTCLDAPFVKKESEIAAMSEEEKEQYLIEKFEKLTSDAVYDSTKKYATYKRHIYEDFNGTEEEWNAEFEAGTLYEKINPIVYYSSDHSKLYDYTSNTPLLNFKYDSYEYRYNKFANELTQHFNLDYLATYFVATEFLELYDSRGKNCMMASWGPQTEGGDYIWFPIFYDMDTQLGINNTGIPSFDFSVDATEEGSFSTNDSVLWNNFFLIFQNQIIQKYCQLKGQDSGIGNFDKLKYAPFTTCERIEGWYESDPVICNSIVMRGQRPLSAINLDEYYKYIAITSKKGGGYLGQKGEVIYDNIDSANGTGAPKGTYYYALQGDRSLSRIQFLKNRMNYIDSWFGVGSYDKSGAGDEAFWGRFAANDTTGLNLSDIWVDNESFKGTENYAPYFKEDGTKTHEFDGEWWLTLTPSRKSYASIIADDSVFRAKYTTTPVDVVMTSRENTIRRGNDLSESLFYLLGVDTMKSLGDLYKLYITELHTTNAPNLTELLLGYDGLDENGNKYKNYNTNAHLFSSMPLLKEANLSNIQYKVGADTSLNFSNSEKLQNFRATGTNFTQVQFAKGVALDTLYLPTTLTVLELTEARQLQNIVTEYHTPTKDPKTGKLVADKGLYIENFTDRLDDLDNAATNLLTLSIINANNLGYDAYKLLNGYYKFKLGKADVCKIAMTDVNWSPYKLVDKAMEYDENNEYYLDNQRFQFVKYNYDPSNDPDGLEWEAKIVNGELYYLDKDNTNYTLIKDITMLEDFANKNAFVGTTDGSTIPNISGIMYVDNDSLLNTSSGAKVNEFYVRNTLQTLYPKLKVFFKNIEQNYSARFVIPDEENPKILTTVGIQTIATGKFENPVDAYGDITELKANNDFYGWAKDNSENNIIVNLDKSIDEWNSEVPTNELMTYYGIFKIHKFVMTFIDGNNESHIVHIPYGELITDTSSDASELFVPKKNDSELAFDKTYKFKGWAFSESGNVINLASYRATKDYIFYGIFDEVSVKESILDNKYLIFTANNQNGYTIKLNPSFMNSLSGKITLPTKYKGPEDADEKYINIIAEEGFSNTSYTNPNRITHIFWDNAEDCKLVEIRQNAFKYNSYLQYFEMPINSEVMVRDYAFQGNRSLFINISNDQQEEVDKFFRVIRSIGTVAFADCQGFKKVRLSSKLISIGQNAFNSTNNMSLFQVGDENSPSNLVYNSYEQNGSIFNASTGNNVDNPAFVIYANGNKTNCQNYADNAGMSDKWQVDIL